MRAHSHSKHYVCRAKLSRGPFLASYSFVAIILVRSASIFPGTMARMSVAVSVVCGGIHDYKSPSPSLTETKEIHIEISNRISNFILHPTIPRARVYRAERDAWLC